MNIPAISKQGRAARLTPFGIVVAIVATLLMLVVAPSTTPVDAAESESSVPTTIPVSVPTPTVELDTGEAPHDLFNAYLTIKVDVPDSFTSQPKIWLWNGESWTHPVLENGSVRVKVTNEFGKYRCYGAIAQYEGMFSPQSDYACYTAALTPPKVKPFLLVNDPVNPVVLLVHGNSSGEFADRYLYMEVTDGQTTELFRDPILEPPMWEEESLANARTCFRARYMIADSATTLKVTNWSEPQCIDLRGLFPDSP